MTKQFFIILPPDHHRRGWPWIFGRFLRIFRSYAANFKVRSDFVVRVRLERQRQERSDRRSKARVVVPNRLFRRPRLDDDQRFMGQRTFNKMV